MQGWKYICEQASKGMDTEDIRNCARAGFGKYGVYPDSINVSEGTYFFIAREENRKVLVIYGKHRYSGEFAGTETVLGNMSAKVCELSNGNCDALRKIFMYVNPKSHKGINMTMGLGDRLGLASPGHLRLLKDKGVFPVLAQQSIRELNLTKRTYEDVLSAASWAVFQEGYKNGFGADGDHLKTAEEVKMALDCGFTMITLDCSEHIDNGAANLSGDELEKHYLEVPSVERRQLEERYLDQSFDLNSSSGCGKITIGPGELRRNVLVYLKAIKHTVKIYSDIIKNCGREIDFEMSIDETLTPTSPESHYFVASELIRNGVEITSLAPRFCGEFQKGIDYRGDLNQFSREFSMHVKIAEHFGYKISVHSGSDKFSVFPMIGNISGGRYHIKTAGTNWLEALRVIAGKNPQLFREIYKYAKTHENEARKYYHVDAKASEMPDIGVWEDGRLAETLGMDDCRQILHITYGLVLQAVGNDGKAIFRDRLYATLMQYEAEYYAALEKHIGRHLQTLGVK